MKIALSDFYSKDKEEKDRNFITLELDMKGGGLN